MKLFKICYTIENPYNAALFNKYVFADDAEEAREYIRFMWWTEVFFIKVEEIEIKKGVVK